MKISKLFKDVFYLRPYFVFNILYYMFIMNKQKVSVLVYAQKYKLNLSRKEGRTKGKRQNKGVREGGCCNMKHLRK